MINRRQLLKGAAVGGAVLLTPQALRGAGAWAAPGQFVNPLTTPPVLDVRGVSTAALTMRNAVHDFGLGSASTYCYQAAGVRPTTYLGPTFVAQRHQALDVTVTNSLGTHPLADFVDEALHGVVARDRKAPRAVVHLHGGNTQPGSDGGPLDVIAPGRRRTYHYDNDQQAAALWYHDHALGITRLNVYAGLAGGYLLRDGNDTGSWQGLPGGEYELPLVLQDRLFTEGALTYPAAADPSVVWAPEMFGDVPVVNGVAWANLEVKRTRYRFRVFNGSNARVYDLRFRVVSSGATLPFHQIGTDGGLLNAPVPITSLVLAPGERADLVVDFAGLPAQARVRLTNRAPVPYPNGPRTLRRGGSPLPELMQFTTAADAPTSQLWPQLRRNVPPVPTAAALAALKSRHRTMTLVEMMGAKQPMMALLNNKPFHDQSYAAAGQHVLQNTVEIWDLVNLTGDAHPIHLHLVQFLVMGRQKLDVAAYGMPTTYPPPDAGPFLRGSLVPPRPNEAGWKDTVLAMPGELTRIVIPFGQPAGGPVVASPRVWPTTDPGVSDYVWHCHILEHEDNDMMQRFRIG